MLYRFFLLSGLFFFPLLSCNKNDSSKEKGTTSDTDSTTGIDTQSDGDTDTDTDGDTDTVDADTDRDTDSDTVTDINSDSDRDTDSEGDWESCPDGSAYVGDQTWQNRVLLKESAVFCNDVLDTRTLDEELEEKLLLRLIPGTYPLPTASGTYDFALPICFQPRQKGDEPVMDGPGSITLTTENVDDSVHFNYEFRQPVTTLDGQNYELFGQIFFSSTDNPTDLPLTIDQDSILPHQIEATGDVVYRNRPVILLNLKKGQFDWSPFTACQKEAYRDHQRHIVTFEGGEITLDLMMHFKLEGDAIVISTEPALFFNSSGTLNGTSFVQDHIMSLIYHPGQHHYTRDFAVFFEDLIGDVCGLKILHLDTTHDDPPTEVYSMNCDLSEIGQRQVLDDQFEEL